MKCAAFVVFCVVLGLSAAIHVAGILARADLAAVSLAVAAEPVPGKAAPKAAALPALKVDRGAPLLLDEPAPKKKPSKGTGPMADNGSCYVCHTNYQEEEMVTVHAENDVGCVKCHGQSLAHRNDENNTTPPDKMYPTDAIDASCATCHDEHIAPAKKVLARWQERCPAKTNPGEVLCTDCHGEHRLKLRTVRWDKKTGKLLPGVRPEVKPAQAAVKSAPEA